GLPIRKAQVLHCGGPNYLPARAKNHVHKKRHAPETADQLSENTKARLCVGVGRWPDGVEQPINIRFAGFVANNVMTQVKCSGEWPNQFAHLETPSVRLIIQEVGRIQNARYV